MKHSNQLQNIITIHKKYLICAQKVFMTLKVIIYCRYIKVLVWVSLVKNSVINTIINKDFRNEIVICSLVIAIILEVISILRCCWIGMNRNGGCKLITHLLNTLLHWLFCIGSFGRWSKRISIIITWRNCRCWESSFSISLRWWSCRISLRGWFRIINCCSY